MLYLKQSTASQAVIIGPFVDKDDGNTQETGLTIANTDIRLSKNGGNLVAKTSGGGTHDEEGWYTITLDATDTNTVGRLQLFCHIEASALPVYHEYQVLEEAVYDAMFASSAALNVGSAASVTAGVTLANGAITDASLAGNMEIVFETDFATNYNQTDNAWVTNGTSFIGTGWNTGKTGYSLTATTGLGNQTANITGNLSGSVGSVTGAVGSVTGAVGSVTAEVTADAVKFGGATVTATTAVTIPASSTLATTTGAVGSVTGAVGSVTGSVGSVVGHTVQTGDTYALANGASGFVAIKGDTAAILIDTADIQPNYATEAKQDIAQTDLDNISNGIITGTAATGTLSTTQCTSSLTGYTDDQLIGRIITFLAGPADGESSDITDYASASGLITFTALTLAPENGNAFKIT